MFQEYMLSFLGLWVIIATIIIQQIVAVVAHRKQKKMVPGVLNNKLSHDSFVFRSHRTFHNSLENVIPFVVPVFMAMYLGVFNLTLAIIVWIFAIARIIHMVLYYKIATEKNPSPRSYFFILGFLMNIVLMVAILIQIFTM